MTEFEQLLQDVMPKIEKLSLLAEEKSIIDSSFYYQFDVKRGLRDINGNGVLAGLTEISDIQAFQRDENGKAVFDAEGKRIPCNGILRYRGIDIKDIVRGCIQDNRYGYEEVVYLLLFGELPNQKKLKSFKKLLGGFRTLPVSFVRDVIMKAPSTDMMNGLARSVLTMYSYDDHPDDISISNVLRQCLQLISQMPLMAVYTYQVYKYYHEYNSLIIHKPRADLSTAEAMLALMRDDEQYTELEARTLDLMLILHAEHGGGNNSTFTTHVVSSSGTDTYSVIAASLGSLKGPRHGGANIKVVKMFDDMKQHLKNRSDGAVRDYLKKLLNKEAFDKSGLIYGMGHAVYSLSDPRADIMRKYVEQLAEEKKLHDDYELYEKIERLAPEVIGEYRTVYKGVAANVDFYSGFVNSMLGIPMELFTPIFAVSRMAGWAAHRIEELSNKGKIIRPSYKGICPVRDYVPLDKR